MSNCSTTRGCCRTNRAAASNLFVDLDTEEQLDRVFAGLSDGATILMPLQEYPFAARFVWLNDRYGVSWQLRVLPAGETGGWR